LKTSMSVSCARLAACVLAAAFFAACAQQRPVQPQRPALLQTASTNALAGNYDQAVQTYTDFLGTNPKPELMAEGYVGRGNAYYKLAKYELAEQDFRAGLNAADDRTMKAQATAGMANSIFAEERFDAAEKLYRQILKSYQGLVQQDEMTYRLAISLARQTRWDEARQLLEQVAGSWPSGDFAKSARAKLASVNDKFFTVQVGAFTNKAMADATVKELKSKGFTGAVEPIDIDGVPGYAVRSGHCPTWQAVTEQADKLKAAGFSTYKLP